MDYARFVRLRRPVWDAFEGQLATSRREFRRIGHAELEEMALRYRQVLHDHALAASRFPGTAAAERLGALALEGTRRLTGEGAGRDDRRGGPLGFFTRAFPRAFRRQLGPFGLAVALFALATLWGLAAAARQPALGLSMLAPEAVAGLEEGRLWTESLTTSVPRSVSSSAIATNNVSVALTAWAGGLLAGIVPLYVVLLNGLMLGSLFGVTAHYSMSGELLEFVIAHGPLEITLILVMAGAGLGLGRAIVAAGDAPRSVALREAGRDALKVLLGCVPWFALLALVEVLVSPSPTIPVPAKAALGLALEALFLAVAFFSGGPDE